MSNALKQDIPEDVRVAIGKLYDFHTWIEFEDAEIGGHDFTTEGHHDDMCVQCRYTQAVKNMKDVCETFHTWLDSQPVAPKPDWVAAILRERDYQDHKWGTIEKNPHSLVDWLCLIREEYAEASAKAVDDHTNEALAEIVQIAALCVACLEQHDHRHESQNDE